MPKFQVTMKYFWQFLSLYFFKFKCIFTLCCRLVTVHMWCCDWQTSHSHNHTDFTWSQCNMCVQSAASVQKKRCARGLLPLPSEPVLQWSWAHWQPFERRRGCRSPQSHNLWKTTKKTAYIHLQKNNMLSWHTLRSTKHIFLKWLSETQVYSSTILMYFPEILPNIIHEKIFI